MKCAILILCVGLCSFTSSATAAEDPLVRREGKYLDLITDLDPEQEINTIVSTFDHAVEQWVAFWNDQNFDPATFRIQAYVMRNEATFRAQGLIPIQVPDFNFGYALNQQIWIKAQPSEYYTRHLVLHEGVHAYMFDAFGGAGTTWFQEGTAELLGLHSSSSDSVLVNSIPTSREQVPFWGRFKRMEQIRQENKVPTVETVMGYRPNLLGDVGSYSWSWALVQLLQGYPEYRETLIDAAQQGADQGTGFNRIVSGDLKDQWPIVSARWRLLCEDLDYGFDWERERVAISVKDPLWQGQPLELSVRADQGWQSIGVRVPGGIKIRFAAEGKITLAETTRPWISEPAGITLQYHRNRPLGQLLVCILPNAMPDNAESLEPLEIHAIDEEKVLEIDQYSWLLFRVNDSVGSLSDNQGDFRVNLTVGS